MSEPDRDYHEGVDALQADMARHQREIAGAEVTTSKNREFAVSVIERLEKENADALPRPVVPTHTPAPPPSEVEKTIDDRKYTIKNEADAPMFRTASQFEHDVLCHAQPRIKLLLTKHESGPLGSPSWSTRALAAMYFKTKSIEAAHAGRTDLVEYYERAYQLDLSELLEASNQAFGDWRKDSPPTLIVPG